LTIGTAYSLYNHGIVGEFKKYPQSGFRDTIKEVRIIIPEGAVNPQSRITFQPQTVKVVLNVNNTVVWINEDDVGHSVVGDQGEFDSGMLSPGQSWNHTFATSGIYGYHGVPHPWMKGTVIVFEE
jgi:plastocyanin